MKFRIPRSTLWLLVIGLTFGLAGPQAMATPFAQELPIATIKNDEGGPVVIVGRADYTDFSIPIIAQEPVPALLDMSAAVQRDNTQFAPVQSQIRGFLTTPISPPPAEYIISLPIEPLGQTVDVDNDTEADAGVQIFRLVLAANISGGSDLVQLDQYADLNSYLTDPLTGEITVGTLLLHADDDKQGFPSNSGDDGLFFTADDAIVGLPQGYTVATLDNNGAVTFDRSAEGHIDVLEKPASESPDFSDQSILESYNSLLDLLGERYAYTELRGLDWDEIRARYQPAVEEADAAQDTLAYYVTLSELARSLHDAHVQVGAPATPGGDALLEAPIAANFGANVVELSDGRFVLTDVLEASPAHVAGLVFGTEIMSVDGQMVVDRLPDVIYTDSTGTEEGQRLRQVRNLLKFPVGTEIELGYRLPDATETLTATLAVSAYDLGDPLRYTRADMPIQYSFLPGGYGYVTWNDFTDPVPEVDMLADFLRSAVGLPGIIIDMRSNGGGWDNQYFTMGSYLFNEESPVSHGWIEESVYDPEADDFVPLPVSGYQLSAPDPTLFYGGDVVVLVDASCASSCEYFTQFLQSHGRATVVGQHGTKGAGGPVNRAAMPDGIIFQYTKSQTRFVDTDTFNLEAKGVEPDVRVPTTLEGEQAKLAGGDPVLDAGLTTLTEMGSERMRAGLIPVSGPSGKYTSVAPADWSLNETINAYIRPAGTELILFSVTEPPATDLNALLQENKLADPKGAFVDTITVNGLDWSIYANVESNNLSRQIAAAETSTATYLIEVINAYGREELMRHGLLEPAINAFVIGDSATEETTDKPATSANIIEATFVCPNGTSLDTVFDNDAHTVIVALPDGTVTLPQVESGSGVQYSDGTTTFWNKGDEAMVEMNGETIYQGCVSQ